jgi:copper homeostasis protein
MIIEVAVDEFEHAQQAEKLGANRIELCANLNEGGTTPSAGLMHITCQYLNIPVHVMIRCRPGTFYFDDYEIDIMEQDIHVAAQAGAKGVVFGLLDADYDLDKENNKAFVKLAKSLGLQTTFHRAFDECYNPGRAFRSIISMGFDHILTSGHESTAESGKKYIAQMVKKAQGKINVMAGKGVNSANAYQLMETRMQAIHFTCRHNEVQDWHDGIVEGSGLSFDDEKLISIVKERNRFRKAHPFSDEYFRKLLNK